MSGAWTPGAPGPIDELVARILLRIEAFVREHGGQARLEVELDGGPTTTLRSLEADPGSGFITLVRHAEDGGDEEWIVPVTAVARFVLRSVEEHEPFGFSLPER
jgi:hypothetical protein